MTSNIEIGLPDGWKISPVLERMMRAALQAVDPYRAVRKTFQRAGSRLTVAGQEYDLDEIDQVILVGAGKASPAMARAVLDVLGDRISRGAVVTKHLDPVHFASFPASIQLVQGSHPVPDKHSIAATETMLKAQQGLKEHDLVICVISGGGSALMTSPATGVTLDALQELTRQLLSSGATIEEMNTLRKHLDRVKGGGLVRAIPPARLATLILSDVVGSPLDAIASGPTVADRTTFHDALAILDRYNLRGRTPREIVQTLETGAAGEILETVKPGDPILARVHNVLVASNEIAARAAVESARTDGWQAVLLTTYLQGEAREAGRVLAAIARQMAASGEPAGRPGVVVIGGETTVTLSGDGKGGRNQEMALGAVREMAGLERTALITLATDGEDGPTDAAGAVVTGDTLSRAIETGVKPEDYLSNNDAYTFFDRIGALIRPGPTGTNVNDLAFIVIW